MKKYLTMVILFCFCFSLVAAEGKVEQEQEQKQEKIKWPNWHPANLFIGPVLLSNVFIVPISLLGPFFGEPKTLYYPLVVPLAVVDGALHTATFGFFYSMDEHGRHDLIGQTLFAPVVLCTGKDFHFE